VAPGLLVTIGAKSRTSKTLSKDTRAVITSMANARFQFDQLLHCYSLQTKQKQHP
jgi:hypothetical protein